jgi:hypothetical protein
LHHTPRGQGQASGGFADGTPGYQVAGWRTVLKAGFFLCSSFVVSVCIGIHLIEGKPGTYCAKSILYVVEYK